jgi:hypothetical protein
MTSEERFPENIDIIFPYKLTGDGFKVKTILFPFTLPSTTLARTNAFRFPNELPLLTLLWSRTNPFSSMVTVLSNETPLIVACALATTVWGFWI